MVSCERMVMVDDATRESVIMQHCAEFPLQSVPVGLSCSEVGCSVLDSNIELSNILDGCKYFSTHEESGSASWIDVTDMPSNARASEYEDADMLLVEKTLDNDCQNCCRTFCGQCEVSNLENGSLSTEEKTHNQDDYQLLSEFKSVNGSPKDMESNIIPSAGDTLVAVEEKNNDSGLLTDTGNHIFDFIYSEFSLESELITGCLVNFHTKSEQEDILRNTDPLEVVDNCNTLSGMEVTACKQISPAQGSNVPSDETSTYRTFSSESGLPSFVSLNDNNPSKDVPDLLLKDNSCVISYNNNACNSGQNDDEGKQIFKIDCVTKSKRSDTGLLPHRRNSRQNKSACKQQTGRAPGKCNKQANMPQQELGVKTISKSTRKKRSCFPRAARSSEWGLLGNVKQAIGMNRELNTNKVMFEGSGKARGSCQSGKTNKDSENSSTFNSMSAASTTRMRLKIKVGKEFNLYYPNIIVPESVDGLASASNLAPGLGSQNSANNTGDKLYEEVAVGKLESDKSNLNKYAVVLNGQIANNLESAALVEKSDGNAEEPCLVAPSKKFVDALIEPVYIKGMDPGTGTSPDSEVIDSIPEVQVGERHQEDLNNTDFGSSKEFNFAVHDTASKRKKKKDTLTCSLNSNVRDVSPDSLGKNKANYSKNLGGKKNCIDAVSSVEFPRSTDINTISISNSVGGEVHTEPLHLHGDIGLREPTDALEVKSSVVVKMHCSLDVNNEYSDSPVSEKFLPSERHLDSKLPKSLKADNVSKTKSKASESKSRKKTACRHGEKQGRSVTKRGVKGKSVSDKVICETDDYLHEENDIEEKQKLGFSGKNYADENKVLASVYTLDMVPGVSLGEQHPSPRNAWVCCDDCHKWRRIPASLADLIEETLCAWTCKDSDDKAYADCSIAQEKSNAEINAELGLSDASGEEDDNEDHKNYKRPEHQRPVCSQESTFSHISANEFLHRSRKPQTIDEIMVCHCKPPPKGQLGCGDECLNRMLNIECVQGACPCGDLCSNQQFQKRNYANLKWFKCGKKGYGLQTIEGISEGQFLIEYVGEVLDMHAYEARQREYALRGQRHFYFMTLNGSEVIDASAKGNLGRFINHSCDPNCRTEKWMVNGEIAIGLFALRDIKQDEEVTFDYNYVRVFGAAAKKCYCGSPHCRGYIGGDPLNAEIIAQDDSDEEFPEPVMLTKGGDIEHGLGALPEKQNSLNPASASSQLHSSIEVENSKGNLSSSIQMKVLSQQMEDVTSKRMPVLQQGYALEPEHSDNTLIPNMETSSFSSASKSKYEVIEDRCGLSEPRLLVKASHINGSVKKGKVCANPTNNLKVGVTTNRLQVPSIRHKKAVEGSSNGRFEAVEEKLKELLDPDGGISKSKDATKGYLKLLLLTVASGDRSNGEGIQSCSNRDLSMILGALLETRPRAVLNDIIKKNGLRMLHNIMKQYRRDFKKIPILRKLLKVLERLAERKILTSEHINGGPPCRGMESFRESILSLTEHEDKEVHQIARSFRDRWIPRSFRKCGFVNRDDCGVKSYRSFKHDRLNYTCEQSSRSTKAIDCAQLPLVETSSVNAGAQEGCSAPSLNGCEISGQVRRKRKSRWDQPAETNSVVSSEHKKGKVVSGLSKQADMIINAVVGQNISEDVPPGFSCLVQPLSFSDASRNSGDLALQRPGHSSSGRPSDAVIGYPREKFNPCLPVSYGVPWPVIQQYGTPHVENEGSWVTAPGMPFYPFPPLPPHGPQNTCQSSKPTDAMKVDQPAEIVKRDSSGLVNCYSDDMAPSTTGLSCEDNNHISKPSKGYPKDLGRSYFGQQKWNKSRIPRPWSRRKFWGYNESNSRGGMGNVGVVDVPEDAICRAVEADNSNN